MLRVQQGRRYLSAPVRQVVSPCMLDAIMNANDPRIAWAVNKIGRGTDGPMPDPWDTVTTDGTIYRRPRPKYRVDPSEEVIDFLDLDPALPTCPSCDCELHDDDRANQPQVDICHQLVCSCHAAYWDQLGELDKRWMWGDR